MISREELARYLAGALDADDERRLRDELSSVRSRLEAGISGQQPDPEVVAQAIASTDRLPVARRRRTPYVVTAALAVLIAAIFLVLRGDDTREYIAAAGERVEATLPDGSVVTLNSASHLVVMEERRVRLKGEALFEVASDPENPFIVQVEGARVRVLGTTFNVEAYDEVSVVVAEGRVALEPEGGEPAELAPGLRGRVVGSDVVVDEVDPREYIAWRTGLLLFRGRTLSEAARELEQWYDADVTLSGGIDTMRVHASLQDVELEEAVLTIASALGLDYEIRGRQVTLRRR